MKKIIAFILLGWICFWAGCNNSLEEKIIKPDWDKGFVMGKQTEEKYLSVVKYTDLKHEQVENLIFKNTPVHRAAGKYFYTLQRCNTQEGQENFVEVFSAESPEAKRIDIHLEDWDMAEGAVWSFDVLDNGESQSYVFAIASGWEANEETLIPTHCYIVHSDNAGTMTAKKDIMPVLLEQGGYKMEALNVYEDKSGFLYLVSGDLQALYVLDKEGAFVTKYICQESEQNFLCPPVKNEEGELVFPVKLGTEGCMRLLWLDKNKRLKELVSLTDTAFTTWYVINGTELYYLDNNTVIKWNVATGYREKIFDLQEAGASKTAATYMFADTQQDIKLRIITQKEDWIVTLSEKPLENTTAVRLAVISGENDFLKSSLANFSRKNPQYSLSYEIAEENKEAYHDRIMIETINGNGPDLLYVPYEDMEALGAKGVLADLKKFISADTLDKILPGVVELGTYEDTMLGIAPDIQVRTLFTSKNTWSGKGWTLDDVLKLIEEKENLEGIFSYTIRDMEPYLVLSALIGKDIEKSQFIDWNHNKSCFEEQNFMEVLEVIKKYAKNGTDTNLDNTRKVLEGAYLAVDMPINLAATFYLMMADIGEEGNAVGYPAQSGQGSYIMTNGLLVVNSKVENKEAIQALLEYILKTETQANLEYALSVRSDITDTTVVYNEYADKYFWVIGGNDNIILESTTDGTTFTEEYKEFLQSCVPYRDNSDIYDIIEEEALGYFEGNRDVLSVVQVIDNRVQLYLDERK